MERQTDMFIPVHTSQPHYEEYDAYILYKLVFYLTIRPPVSDR